MTREPMTLEELRATRPLADSAKIAGTTEEDIYRHKIEDGEDSDALLPPYCSMPTVWAFRAKL